MAAQVVNVHKPSCEFHHPVKLREFRIDTSKMSSEELEMMFLCHPGTLSEVSMSTSDIGPRMILKGTKISDLPYLFLESMLP
jgi:hypothetical protein